MDFNTPPRAGAGVRIHQMLRCIMRLGFAGIFATLILGGLTGMSLSDQETWPPVPEVPDSLPAFVLPDSVAVTVAMPAVVVTAARSGSNIVQDIIDTPDVILVGNGSEVSTLIDGAGKLKSKESLNVRVVSAPSEGLFRLQPKEYQEKVLPGNIPTFGMTAGLPVTLMGLVGPKGKVFGLDHFGYSAPYKVLDEKLGFTGENVYAQVVEMLGI